ncbi:hypothetical protein L228DRAFT_32969 [Xylona heveae TC161]|uniref:Uncharacterized protein n=1 Tax=Xylona heveae (strain CBS 132557 / TC161) TaxID=1328760 RepID=A0A165A5I7_XYLHT|nr:hypothetical protein L228DRAFT_32969 [Xylona heveae TC161]KZF19981.1 hypothetical protein L228DRAFT_32969 [Xylona heveae TC161]
MGAVEGKLFGRCSGRSFPGASYIIIIIIILLLLLIFIRISRQSRSHVGGCISFILVYHSLSLFLSYRKLPVFSLLTFSSSSPSFLSPCLSLSLSLSLAVSVYVCHHLIIRTWFILSMEHGRILLFLSFFLSLYPVHCPVGERFYQRGIIIEWKFFFYPFHIFAQFPFSCYFFLHLHTHIFLPILLFRSDIIDRERKKKKKKKAQFSSISHFCNLSFFVYFLFANRRGDGGRGGWGFSLWFYYNSGLT